MQNTNLMTNKNSVLTKDYLEKVLKTYNICKHNELKQASLNEKFVEIVEEATRNISDFAQGKIKLDVDALELMKAYIEEFGKEYMRYDNTWKYEFTLDAQKAKSRLDKIKCDLEYNECQVPVSVPAEKKNFTSKRSNKDKVCKITKNGASTVEVLRINSVLNPQEESVSINPTVVVKHLSKKSSIWNKFNIKSLIERGSRKIADFSKYVWRNLLNGKNNILPSIEKSISVAGRGIKSTKNEVVDLVSKSAKRYALAGLTMFGSVGNLSSYSSVRHDKVDFGIKKYEQIINFDKEINKNDTVRAKVVNDNIAMDTVVHKISKVWDAKCEDVADVGNNANWVWQSILMGTVDMNNLYNSKKETEAETIANMSYPTYKFSIDDVKALEGTKLGNDMAEHAWKVARKMNAKGLCYRAVKRMFAKGKLGELHGGSAYMAKQYLDKNPFYKKIYCDVDAVQYLPNGSCIVLGRNSRHIHGHVAIIGRDEKGKPKDLSSKVRNILGNMKDYNGICVYVPADTPIPQRVQEGIDKIMVLKRADNNNQQFALSLFANELANEVAKV